MKKRNILIAVALLAVGFATVSTTLYLNGVINFGVNTDDFDVYFSKATVNGIVDNSVITNSKTITFTKEMKDVGETYTLDYDVTNGSKNYDASLTMNCTGSSEYLNVNNSFDTTTDLPATETRSGELTVEMVKSYVGDTDLSVTITCEIDANAVERSSLATGTPADKVVLIPVTAVDENGKNLNATSYEITGTTRDTLLDKLVELGKVESASDVDALIEVESDDFENLADTTFDVSNIANDGDTVVILHFNEETQEWEYVGEETVEDGKVSGDFSSYSPVAFVVKKFDGTYETLNSTVAQVSFADDSWSTIAKAVKSGNYIYKVGDTKTVDMGDLGTHIVRVANTTACTTETSETACGFVVEFADIIATHVMNSTRTSVGGWPASGMRTYVNGTVYNALPSDLQSVISETTVVSGHGSTSGETNFKSKDKLYLLSAHEVLNDGTINVVSTYDTSYSETRQLDYYANLGVTTNNYSGAIKQYDGGNFYWWLRSAISSTNCTFLSVTDSGRWSHDIAATATGVSPAFRIA